MMGSRRRFGDFVEGLRPFMLATAEVVAAMRAAVASLVPLARVLAHVLELGDVSR